MGLTREQISSYLASKGLPFTEAGIAAGLQSYNAENPGGAIDPAMIPEAGNKSFTDAFGPDAYVGRPGPNGFTVRTRNPLQPTTQPTTEDEFQGGGFAYRNSHPDTVWAYDNNTQTFTNPNTGAKVPIGSLGFKDPITANFEVGRLASIEGKNIDEWSAYGPSKSNEAYGKSADTYRGALMNDLGKILDYEKPSALDNFMEAAIPAIVLSTMTAGATGMFDAGGSLASLAGNGATAGEGLLATQAAAPVTDATMTAVGGGEAGGGGYFGGASASGSGITGATTTGGGITGATTGGTLGVSGTTAASAAFDPTVASVMASTGKSAADAARIVSIAQSSTSGGVDAVRETLTKMGVPSGVIDTLVKIVPPVAGALVASAGGGGAKEAGTTTTTSAQAPWTPMQPYLTGIAKSAETNYNTAKTMTPEQKALVQQAQGLTSAQMNDPNYQQLRDGAADMIRGKSDLFTPAANIAGPNTINATQVDPNQWMSAGAPTINAAQVGTTAKVDPTQAFKSLGSIDPTNAYRSLLSGDVSNPYLQNIAQDNYTMANRNLLENVMPGIRSGSQAAGQYGGSRQGIAEGLAISRMNQDVTTANNQMYGNAYQQAQGNMLSAAGQLGGIGSSAASQNASSVNNMNQFNASNQQQANIQNASNMLNNNQFNSNLGLGAATNNANRSLTADTTNASNQLGTQQFNANLGLTNNTQKLGQMTAGLDMYNQANNMQNTGIKNALDMSNYNNTYQNDALKNYAGIVSPLGGLGGTGTQSTPYYNNPTNNLLGGAIAGSTIFKNIFGS